MEKIVGLQPTVKLNEALQMCMRGEPMYRAYIGLNRACDCFFKLGARILGFSPDQVKHIVGADQAGLGPIGDINSLAGAIIRLLCEPALREKMGKNAQKKVKDYSWEKIAKMTEKVYELAMTNV